MHTHRREKCGVIKNDGSEKNNFLARILLRKKLNFWCTLRAVLKQIALKKS
jgi:hypothetical protein